MSEEGLIRTHNLQKTIDYLQTNLYLGDGVEYKEYKNGTFFAKFYGDILCSELLEELLRVTNNFGYIPAVYRTKDWKVHKFNETEVDHNISDIFDIIFSPKYSLPVNVKDLPSILYHVCNLRNIEKILKIGLVPKSNSNFEAYPSRIYFATNVDSLKKIIKNPAFKKKSTSDEYCILSINIDKLNDVDFYLDTASSNSIYVVQNIPPSAIINVNKLTKS